MPDLFANPWGFLGLLAIPAILAIHFLREKSRRVKVSTLFLLERLDPRTPTGRTLQKLQNSLPLWLQLLIALLCTWLLVQPHWLRKDSRQTVTLILDPSASMTVARLRVVEQMPEIARAFAKGAARTDWVLLSADRPESPLYRGPEISGVERALSDWQPLLPEIDPARAFSIALLDSRGGPVLYISDRPSPSLPGGIALLAFGEAIDNCGFAGARAWRERGGAKWEVLIRNAGSVPQVRQWWTETEKTQSQRLEVTLQPGEIVTIPGSFQPDEPRLNVILSADGFLLDDVVPLVAPEPKPLLIAFQAANVPAKFVERVLATVPGAQRVGDGTLADVILTNADAVQSAPAEKPAVIFGASAGQAPGSGAPIAIERHPLTEGALWNGLLSAGAAAVKLGDEDQPLVWQRDVPLLYLKQSGNARHLVFNFDFARSNADRLPAVVLAFSRFLLEIQSAKEAKLAQNFETNQVLPLPPGRVLDLVHDSGGSNIRAVGGLLRAPLQPGFFRVQGGEAELLSAAARFGDPRESDFREATTNATKLDRARLIPRENLEEDRWSGVWLTLLAAALLGSWVVQNRMPRT